MEQIPIQEEVYWKDFTEESHLQAFPARSHHDVISSLNIRETTEIRRHVLFLSFLDLCLSPVPFFQTKEEWASSLA